MKHNLKTTPFWKSKAPPEPKKEVTSNPRRLRAALEDLEVTPDGSCHLPKGCTVKSDDASTTILRRGDWDLINQQPSPEAIEKLAQFIEREMLVLVTLLRCVPWWVMSAALRKVALRCRFKG